MTRTAYTATLTNDPAGIEHLDPADAVAEWITDLRDRMGSWLGDHRPVVTSTWTDTDQGVYVVARPLYTPTVAHRMAQDGITGLVVAYGPYVCEFEMAELVTGPES